jgi:DNA-directed RNA polymerase specialized sigma24 family protein
VEARDLLEHLQEAIQSWPRLDREVFELHFVKGFEPHQVAMIIGRPLQNVNEKISSLQKRLRERIAQEVPA